MRIEKILSSGLLKLIIVKVYILYPNEFDELQSKINDLELKLL